jgi:hypothetical protein
MTERWGILANVTKVDDPTIVAIGYIERTRCQNHLVAPAGKTVLEFRK